MDNTKEYILCAAIWFKCNDVLNNKPINIDKGIVLCGFRHGDIFSQTGLLVKQRIELGVTEEVQGFLTSKNRFVTREEAALIAISQDQFANDDERQEVIKSHYLYSENIY